MMLANDLKTYYDEVRRYLDCPKAVSYTHLHKDLKTRSVK